MSKGFSKYIAVFDYFDKTLTFSSAISGGIPISSFATNIGALVGKAGVVFTFLFSITSGIVKKTIKNNTE